MFGKAIMVYYDFGCAIRYLRRKRGMTQEHLSLKSGVSRAMVIRVEKGERNISAQKLGAIAAALNVSPQEIYDIAGCCYGNSGVCQCMESPNIFKN